MKCPFTFTSRRPGGHAPSFRGESPGRGPRIPAIFVMWTALFLVTACAREAEVQRVSRPLMGTVVTVTAVGDAAATAVAAERAFDEIRRVEEAMSPKMPGSDVARVNAGAARSPVAVSGLTFEVISRSLEIGAESGGALDVTFAALESLWNYRDPAFAPPSPERVGALLPLVNYRNVVLDRKDRSVFFTKQGMRIGLGAVAKGYAVGRAARALREAGIGDGIVEAGGDLQVLGTRGGKPWIVGLRDPRGRGMLLSLALSRGESVATSGDYERFAARGGKRYHHIIDPRTGTPTKTFTSVSVVAADPLAADAWATAFFVMGPAETRRALSLRKSLSVVIVDLNGKVSASARLKERIVPREGLVIEWF